MEIETIPSGAPDAGAGQSEAPKTEATTANVAGGDDGGKQPGHEQQGDQNTHEQKSAEQRYKIKFGKNERELSVDELRMYAQKGWAADSRFQEAARMRKEVEEAVRKADWDRLIAQSTGKSAVEFYKERLKAEIRKAQMSDDERAVEEKRGELERLKAEENEIIQRREEAQRERMTEQYSQQWDKELSEAIEKEGLPKTKYAVQRAVQIGKKVVDMGLEPDWVAITREAKAQIMSDMKGLMSAFREDPALLNFLGDEMAQRISKALVNRKQPQPVVNRKAVESVKDNFRQKEAKSVDVDDWIAERRKKFENG